MIYREILPPALLAEDIACLWFQDAGAEPYQQRVVPDACADVIAIGSAAPIVVGPAARTVFVDIPANTAIVGVRFRPGRAPAVLGMPVDGLLDVEVPLADVWGKAAEEQIWNRLGEAPGVPDKLKVLEQIAFDKVSRPGPSDALVTRAVDWLARHPDRHVDELVSALGVSGRQLLRRFRRQVGYGPKLLQRILRFQRLLVLAAKRPHPPLASLALEAGYLDQAHMNREVLELSGVTPRKLLGPGLSPQAMSEFFNTVDALGP